MPTTAADTKKTKKAPKAVAVVPEPQPLATIAKRVPRPDPLGDVTRAKAGRYRVIHGRVCVPLPESSYLAADGRPDPRKPTFEYALMGDEVDLGSDDATRMLALGTIEELDAKPSKLGKVWTPPIARKAS